MRIEGYRIWVVLFIAIFIVSGYLYHSIQKNREQLNTQSIHSLELTKNNLLGSWDNYKVREGENGSFPDSLTEKTPWLREILEELLDRMPPGEFFDHIVLTRVNGEMLISSPDIPVRPLQFDQNSEIENSKINVSRLGEQVFQGDQIYRVPLTLDLNQENQAGGDDLELYLYGVISQEKFGEASRKISFTTLYVLSTFIFLLIVSFPLLRVFGLGRGDTLLRSHIYQVGLSLILLALLIGFSISYLASRSETKKDQQKTVQKLSDDVFAWHQRELSNYAGLLDNYFADTVKTEEPDIAYNELFQMNQNGNVIRMRIRELRAELDSAGLSGIPDLSDREYFKRAGQEAYFLGSHFSYSDGRQEGVISRREENKTASAAGSSLPEVRAVTFNFDNFDRADTLSLNPLGLKYLIINESGDVFYQPPSIPTVVPNLQDAVTPVKWREINTLMRNNSELEDSLEVQISFEGQTYIAHLRKFDFNNLNLQDPVWMLTFRDENLRYFRSYSIFMYSAIGYVILVVLFLIISLFSYVTRQTSHYLNLKTFSFSWFRPSHKKRRNYSVLFLITFVHIFFFLYLMWRESHNFWFVIFLFCEAFIYVLLLSYVLLSDFLKHWKSFRHWTFPVLVFLTTFILSILTVLTSTEYTQWSWLATSLFMIQITGLIWVSFLNKKSWFSPGHNDYHVVKRFENYIDKKAIGSAETIFACTFTLWIVLAGLLPGYMFHHTAFHYEDRLWHKAATLPSEQVESRHHESPDNIGRVQQSLLDEMEYQRRQWLENYSGIEYLVIDLYMYIGKEAISGALYNDDPTHEEGKALGKYLLITILFAIFGYILYLIIQVLSRRIFLTQYWNFTPDKGLTEEAGNQCYLISLDNQKALEFLKKKFLKEKKFNIFDLSRPSVRKKISSFSSTNLKEIDGLILLNIESALNSRKDIDHVTNLISEGKENNRFIVMTGSKSMKELRDFQPATKDPEFEKAMINWIETTGSFVTMILPLHYDIDQSTGVEYIEKLHYEIRYGPHHSILSGLLNDEIEKRGKRNFDIKTFEKFLLTVQRNNKAYFQNIWEKLTFREKQMVHNYANEGFVNYSNFDVLTELLQKGIFRMDREEEEIKLFNQSFRNYATQAASSDLLKAFKRDKKEHGNLNHMRNAVLTFLFLAVLGVSVIAPELLDRYIGAISGGLAILSSFASFANKMPMKIPFMKGTQLNV